ncbi:MAG TPA: winged helix-turn-helix domain-containing protein [Bdellovibrionales bacterium]|nr:winged helix-turn-helix domain-containing protein [Bdellovibrionales bacterium]
MNSWESGLLAYNRGDYVEALGHFEPLRNSEPAARVYALLCLESLGFETGEAFAALCADAQVRARPELDDLLESYSLRRLFKAGRAAEAVMGADSGGPSSAAYRLWLRQLPFHTGFEPLKAGDAAGLAGSEAPGAAYRLRTLLGQRKEDDLRDPDSRAFAERFYLWVWRWLANESSTTAEDLQWLLDGRDLSDARLAVDVESRELLANALGWIGVFAPMAARAQPFPEGDVTKWPWLEFERLVIRWLQLAQSPAPAAANDALERLKAHALWSASSNALAMLLQARSEQATDSGPLRGLIAELQAVLSPPTFRQGTLFIDMMSFELKFGAGDRVIRSRPLCELMAVLRAQHSVSFEDVAWLCYGHSQYDLVYHSPKIFNLISRLKKLLPHEARLRSKDYRLYFEGDWNRVVFREPGPRVRQLQTRELWKKLLGRQGELSAAETRDEWCIKPSLILRALRGEGGLTRADIEELTNKSRSTVHRTLTRLLENGQIERRGRGAATVYVLKDPAQAGEASSP